MSNKDRSKEIERLLWNLVSGTRVMSESDAKKTDPIPGMKQTEDAVKALAAFIAKVTP